MNSSHTSQPCPQIELIPLRAAVCSDQPTTLDVLVRITPPTVKVSAERPRLNLGFVIDRSGSMQEFCKIEYARQAVCYAIEQLLPSDRLSVTIFDDEVEVLVASTPATHKATIINQVKQVHPRGCTALHQGWLEGGMQVSQHLLEGLNRVILLSDGLANVGETDPDVIASHVHGLSKRGVSTSTLGVGNDYNEDLMEAIARSGDGNYYYIESPSQLPQIFAKELNGLVATVGTKVSLGVEPQNGVELVEVLNELTVNQYGRFYLPNLVIDNPINVVVRLKVPAANRSKLLCNFRLAWNPPQGEPRQTYRVSLQLPVVTATQFEQMLTSPIVEEQVMLLQAARAKQEAVRRLDAGDLAGAGQVFNTLHDVMSDYALSMPEVALELESIEDLQLQLRQRKLDAFRKKSRYQSYQRNFSRNDAK